MNIKNNFFAWHWGRGLEEMLEIWKNFLRFAWFYFSLKKNLFSLFSPWKRDVVFRNWQGWHPLESLEVAFNNFISRLIGCVIRILVLTSGLICWLIVFLVGILMAAMWISWPLLMIASLSLISKGTVFALGSVLFFIFPGISFFFYCLNKGDVSPSLVFKEIMKKNWSGRILNRLGLSDTKENKNILLNQELFSKFLRSNNISQEELERIVNWESRKHQEKIMRIKFWRWENLRHVQSIGRYWKYGYTPHLDKFSIDLTEEDNSGYAKLDVLGRERELEVVKLVLERQSQNNILLAGSPGVGKKTIVHFLARLIREGRAGSLLNEKRIVVFDPSPAISSFMDKGADPEVGLRQIFFEAAYAGNVIIVIEDFSSHALGGGKAGSSIFLKTISEFFEIPSFQLIAAATARDYHELARKSEGLVKSFDVVEVGEPSQETALEILLQVFGREEEKNIFFTFQALRNLIEMSGQYNWSSVLPERAIDLAEEVLIFWGKGQKTEFITTETVSEFMSMKTGVPLGEIGGEEKEKLLGLEKILHHRIIGQERAVRMVSEALRRSRVGAGRKNKPIGSFLFLGPTGVGKTETAKALAHVYFGSDDKMIRLDMSEYQNPESIERIIGSAKNGSTGILAGKAKENAYSILLLDEIEKAYPGVLDLFLQIIDEGFFTDAFGEKINMRNMIIIATSNAGSALLKELHEKGEAGEKISQLLTDYVIKNNIFRSEFLNRFDGVIFFSPLGEQEIRSVTRLILSDFAGRLKKEKDIEIEFTGELVEKIVEKGYNQTFGARSIYHFVEEKLDDLIVKKIISGEYDKGDRIKISDI